MFLNSVLCGIDPRAHMHDARKLITYNHSDEQKTPYMHM